MKILLIGSGGREHAIAWKLSQSPRTSHIFCAPGNPGIAQYADCVNIQVDNYKDIEAFAKRMAIDLVVIGPEDPLAAGLTDRLQKLGYKVFGPKAAAAQLEADKWFAKELMRAQAVPTAEARMFTNANAADEYIKMRPQPIVIKAAGLAKGKGVSVCYREEDALAAVDQCLRKKVFGEAGAKIVIEEFMNGPECSILAFIDRKTIYLMESAQDHKTIDEGDTGPMTGGMGAYTPTPLATPALLSQIEKDVFVPVLDGLTRDGIEYKGVLYAGLILTANGPRVLEFNCRFGDPETQPLLMRLKTDLLEVMMAVVEGRLDELTLVWDKRPAMTVVASSKGYPGKTVLGDVIEGVEEADKMKDVKVFHSGTAENEAGDLITAGGRVLAVTALGDTLAEAQQRCYEAMAKISFEGMHFRRDIGHRALKH